MVVANIWCVDGGGHDWHLAYNLDDELDSGCLHQQLSVEVMTAIQVVACAGFLCD
jgi:hypothetical protein